MKLCYNWLKSISYLLEVIELSKESENIIKSKFFLRLFGIPSVCFSSLVFIGMFLPDEPGEEPIGCGDVYLGLLVILALWFCFSFFISLIFNKIKKVKSKTKVDKQTQYISKYPEKVVVNYEKKDEFKEDKKKKTNDKCLYTCESNIDSYEYKKMVRYFPQMYWFYVLSSTVMNLVLYLILSILFRDVIGTLIIFVIFQIYIMILVKVRLERFAEKYFNSFQKKGGYDTEFHTKFYDNYFIRQGKIETIKIFYDDIDKSIETNTNFYLKLSKRNKIIIIQKNSCDLELISFIREKFKDLENHLGEDSNFKGVKKYNNPKFIKNFMIILFAITILSIYGAGMTWSLTNIINPQHGFNFTRTTWVFWCWLPIPLLSIILGFKYNSAGFKCTKNIVGGFIIGFLLLIYGSFCLFPGFSRDYSEIDAYRNIIDADLPDDGELEIQDWDTYFDQDKTGYVIINAYYDREDVTNLVNSIENNSNWILSKEITSDLKLLLPSQLRSDDDAYFSIYNMSTAQYNTLPEKSGDYEIYAMKYDKSDKQLEIHKFNINLIFN